MYSSATTATASRAFPVGIEPIATGPSARPVLGPLRHYGKDEEIFGEGEPASHYYKVVSGVVRTCKILSDGRRQIDAFHVAGDMFGIERGAEYRVTAEAVGEAMIASFWRCSLEEPADPDRGLAREVVATALLNLERAQEHMILLGRKSATEKVATFLLAMAERIEGDAIELPMSRSDIADYLGLTIETVSRTLTRFERKGAIELSTARRTIRLRDEPGLRRLDL
jgi:CRP/FNR family transcriptional regulator, nitrogen fixation regulation protein